MKITKDYEGIKRNAIDDYVIDGDLISEETIEIDLDDRLLVAGRIVTNGSLIARSGIVAGEGIKAGRSIEAGCGIEAGESIEAGCGIKAGFGIKAGKYINAGERIFAGLAIYHNSRQCNKQIRCRELRSGEIAYGDLVLIDDADQA